MQEGSLAAMHLYIHAEFVSYQAMQLLTSYSFVIQF